MAPSYVVPFVLYLTGIVLAAQVPGSYPLDYSVVVLLVSLIAWLLLRGRGILQPHFRIAPAVLLGLAGIALWIGLSELKLEQQLAPHLPVWLRPAPRAAFNPFQSLTQPEAAWAFVAVRLAGLVLLVPLVEELFWRGFLLRWLISPDWESVPPGTFSGFSFAAVTLLFTLAHSEWLAAAVYCALLNGFLYWKKDLWSCIVAHAVSNFTLGAYILATGSWWLW